jgi:putrescine---pyruvate transaminase
MSVNGNSNFRRPYEPLLPGCFHIDTPWLYRNPYTDDPVRLGEICAEMLDRELVFQGPDTVAAFIAEPVQGAGGVIVPPENFWPLIRKVCDKHGVLLIADEVVTGFGRTGHLFGTRLWGVQADMWCLAKGISSGYVPLGATAISGKVAEVFGRSDAAAGAVSHGYTYSAHPVAAAAALATLEVLGREDVLGNVRRQGEHLMSRLQDLGNRSRLIGDVRGIGLMACLELIADKATKAPFGRGAKEVAAVAREAYRRGAMVRTSGPNIILSPALTIERAQIDLICDALEGAFAAVEG